MTVLYWTAAFIGALVVFLIIRKYSNISGRTTERFTGEDPKEDPKEEPKADQAQAQNAMTNNYTETLTLKGFPKLQDAALAIYLSSFSDLVAYTEGAPIPPATVAPHPAVYDGNMGMWRDLLSADNSFRLNVVDTSKGVLPPMIKTRDKDGVPVDIGLSLQSLRLVGPSSRALGNRIGSTTAFELTPFTVTFYGIIENLDFAEGEQRKVLFRVTAENPDLIEIAVRRRDNRNVLIEVIIGEAGRAYQWVVDKFMLMSNRQPTLYALSYDKGSKVTPVSAPAINFYIGKTKMQKTFAQEDAPDDIRLGNSEVTLNPTGLFNMKLVAFAYFKSVLDDKAIDELGKYFTQQHNGIDVLIKQKEEQYLALTTELQKRLANANRTLDDAEDELKQCKEAAEAALKASPQLRKRQWQVSLDGTGASQATAQLTDDDLQKCAPLALASKLAQLTAQAPLPKLTDPRNNQVVPTKPAPFKKVQDPNAPAASTAPAATTSSASKSGASNDPPASLSDPNASIWERINDVWG